MKFKILSLITALLISFGCAFGLTACNEVSIKSAEINANGELIITMTDGTTTNLGKVTGADGEDGEDGVNGSDGAPGAPGADGEDGKDGVGIATAYIDENGRLIIVLTSGERIDCGKVSGGAEAPALNYSEADGGYVVTGITDASVSALQIPATYNGKPVTGIAEEAFAGSNLVSVSLPDGVTAIGARAFADCSELKSITFGKGVKTVGAAAFARCSALSVVNITDIGAWCGIAFAAASSNPLYFAHTLYLKNAVVTEINLPDSVTAIADYAFYGCDKLVGVNAGNGALSIGKGAFYGCSSLERVAIGAAETIGEEAFADCVKLDALNLGSKLKSIGGFAFNRCEELVEISFPSTLEDVGENAFAECRKLKTVGLNEGLKTIGDGAFCGCPLIESFIMPDSVVSLGFGVLMNIPGGGFDSPTGEVSMLSELRISNSLTEIPDYAFSKTVIKRAVIGNSVVKINYSSFFGCASLESLVIPVSVKHIASYSFYKCDSLQTVYYEGTEDQWRGVFVGKNGNDIHNAQIYFYSPAKPSVDGQYWHYVDGVPAVW